MTRDSHTVAAGKALLSITLDGQTYTHSISSDMVWESGKLHNFTMKVYKREASGDYEIKVTDDGLTPWVNDETSHQFSAMAYVVVNCDQYGTNLRCGVEEGQPVGHVGSPDAHVGATLHANADQALGQVIDTLVELAPSEAQVAV